MCKHKQEVSHIKTTIIAFTCPRGIYARLFGATGQLYTHLHPVEIADDTMKSR